MAIDWKSFTQPDLQPLGNGWKRISYGEFEYTHLSDTDTVIDTRVVSTYGFGITGIGVIVRTVSFTLNAENDAVDTIFDFSQSSVYVPGVKLQASGSVQGETTYTLVSI